MEKVYQELEEAKQEIKELKKQLQTRSSGDSGAQNANPIIERQNHELAEKAGETFTTKELDEELESKIVGKESAIAHLNFAIDKLRLDYDEKLKRYEEEYSRLLVALDEANEKNKEGEHKIKDLECENERLKGLLYVRDKESYPRVGNADAQEGQMRQREEFLEEMEEERRKVQEQLKWKAGQFKLLEEVHEKLREKLYATKSEWEIERLILLDEISTMQTSLVLRGKTNYCGSSLDSKDEIIDKLRAELETCHRLMTELKLQNEELSHMFLLLKSEITELESTHANENSVMDSHSTEKESSTINIIALMENLEVKNAALVEARNDIERQREDASSLLRKLQDLNGVQEQQQHEKEMALQKHQGMTEESTGSPYSCKERLLSVSEALERVNSELAEGLYEGSETELELQIWKSIAEQLKVRLDGNQHLRKQLEFSLLEQAEFEEILRLDIDRLKQIVEDKDRRIDHLHEQILLLDKGIIGISRGEGLLRTEDNCVKSQDAAEIEWLEQESLRRELEGAILAQIRAERTIEQVMKLSGDSENLLAFIEGLCRGVSKLSSEDNTLPIMLGKIVQTIGNEIGVEFWQGYERCPAKENVNLTIYPMTKACEVAVNEISPFRELI